MTKINKRWEFGGHGREEWYDRIWISRSPTIGGQIQVRNTVLKLKWVETDHSKLENTKLNQKFLYEGIHRVSYELTEISPPDWKANYAHAIMAPSGSGKVRIDFLKSLSKQSFRSCHYALWYPVSFFLFLFISLPGQLLTQTTVIWKNITMKFC